MAQSNIQSWRPDLNGKIHPAAVSAINLIFDAIQDHDTAIVALNSKVGTPATTPATVVPSTPSTPSSSSPLGIVNLQTGTVYATMLTDNGGLVVMSNGAAMAVTLTSTVTAPFFMSFLNLGGANAVLTPSSGNINNVASITVLPAGWAILYLDGTGWWSLASPVLPVTTASVAHQWFASYNAATGAFTQTQPAIADVSGLTAALGLLAPIASPTFTGAVTQPAPNVLTAATTTTSATTGTATALPALPAAYLTVSVNGTTYKIPLFLP